MVATHCCHLRMACVPQDGNLLLSCPILILSGTQKAVRREYFSPTFSSQHLENLLGHTCSILPVNARIHIQMLLLNLLIPGTGMVFPFPNPFVESFAGTKQDDGSPQAMQTLSEGPGASFSKTETQTTVKRSLELGLAVLQKEDLLRVQTVNFPKKTPVSLLLALYKHQLVLKLALIFCY